MGYKLYTEAEKSKLLAELLDREKTVIICEKHHYAGEAKQTPAFGCEGCAKVTLFKAIAEAPPHLRQERLERLEAIIHALCELDSRGQLDFKPKMGNIRIDKNAA